MSSTITSSMIISSMFVSSMFIGGAGTRPAFAADADQELFSVWAERLAAISSYSALEGAGSHGSMSQELGVGRSVQPSVTQKVQNNEIAFGSQTHDRLWIVSGTPLPVDIGIGLGRLAVDRNETPTSLGGHIQWTIYEALAHPSLAVRFYQDRLIGSDRVGYSGKAAGLVGSYGFLRYFEIYGSLSHRSQEVTLTPDPITGLALADFLARDGELSRRWQATESSAGVKIRLYPFLALTAERQLGSAQVTSAKLSLWL